VVLADGSVLQNLLFFALCGSVSKLTIDNGQLTIVDAGYARADFINLGAPIAWPLSEIE